MLPFCQKNFCKLDTELNYKKEEKEKFYTEVIHSPGYIEFQMKDI